MNRLFLPLCLALACLVSCKGKKNKAVPESDPAKPGVAETPPRPAQANAHILRFWDARHQEHVYTHVGTEPDDWKKSGVFRNEHLVGYGAHALEPGTVKIERAYCKDGRHYYYIEKPTTATDIVRMETYSVYVWTQPGDGRVPVHASYLPNDKDPLFDTNLDAIKFHASDTLQRSGTHRKIVESAFYVYPSSPNDKKSPPSVIAMPGHQRTHSGSPPAPGNAAPGSTVPSVVTPHLPAKTIASGLEQIGGVAISADGTTVGVHGDHSTVYFDLSSGTAAGPRAKAGSGEIASGGRDTVFDRTYELVHRDIPSGKEMPLCEFKRGKTSYALVPDGKTVLVAEGTAIQFRSTFAGKPVRAEIRTATPVLALSRVFRQGTRIASLHDERSNFVVRIWDVEAGTAVDECPLNRAAQDGRSVPLDVAEDGRAMVVGGANGAFEVWDLSAKKKQNWQFKESPEFVCAMNGGRFCYDAWGVERVGNSIERTRSVEVVDLASSRVIAALKPPEVVSMGRASLPIAVADRRVVAVGAALKNLYVWDLTN